MRDDAADVVVVGGGPTGLAAAIALREHGVARVVVVEREPEVGGVPRWTDHTGFGVRDLGRVLSGPVYARRYARRAAAAGVALLPATTVTALAGPEAITLASAAGLRRIAARAVLLATGCRERPRSARLVAGSRPLGVLTTGSLQRLAVAGLPVGRRAVVVGAEHVSFSAVLTLAHAGAETVALVTAEPRHQTWGPLAWWTAGRRGIPILADTTVTAVRGARRVEAVEIAHAGGTTETLACDTVVFTGDWIPEHEVVRRAGIAIDAATRGPLVDGACRTSAPGVFAAGNLVHAAEPADVAALAGRHAAAAIVDHLRDGAWPVTTPVALSHRPPIAWIAPGAIAPDAQPPEGRFTFRVASGTAPGRLVVAQGQRVLRTRRHGTLLPGRSLYLSAAWVPAVDPAGPPVVVRVGT